MAIRGAGAAVGENSDIGNTPAVESQRVAAFVQRLRELGWSEGRDLAIAYRWAEGRSERFIEIAACRVRAHRAGGVSSGAARQKFQGRIGLARPENTPGKEVFRRPSHDPCAGIISPRRKEPALGVPSHE